MKRLKLLIICCLITSLHSCNEKEIVQPEDGITAPIILLTSEVMDPQGTPFIEITGVVVSETQMRINYILLKEQLIKKGPAITPIDTFLLHQGFNRPAPVPFVYKFPINSGDTIDIKIIIPFSIDNTGFADTVEHFSQYTH